MDFESTSLQTRRSVVSPKQEGAFGPHWSHHCRTTRAAKLRVTYGGSTSIKGISKLALDCHPRSHPKLSVHAYAQQQGQRNDASFAEAVYP